MYSLPNSIDVLDDLVGKIGKQDEEMRIKKLRVKATVKKDVDQEQRVEKLK